MRALVLLLGFLVLAGCDKLTGVADQKIADAEAIGFACRVSGKSPEDCMKENEAQSPSSILDGWKSADEDIKAGKLDPKMSNAASEAKPDEAAAEGEPKPETDKPAVDKPVEGVGKKDEKPAQNTPVEEKKDGKTGTAQKPSEAAAHDKPAH